MKTTIKIDMSKANDVIKRLGLSPGGIIQKMLTSEVQRISDPFVPMDNGPLKNQVMIAIDGTWFEYLVPYARYHWFGEVMVSPTTGSPFAKKNEQKVLAEPKVLMQYTGAPQRGPKWVERAWAQHGEEILTNLERKINK